MTIKAIFPVRGYGVHALPLDEGPEAATQTFVKGSLVIFTGGYVTVAGADPVNIVGVALEAGHNDVAAGTSNITYAPAVATQVFEGTVDTSAAFGTGAIAATDLGLEYGITLNSGVWYVDKNKTGATGRCRIVRLIDPVGTVNGRVHFVFTVDNTIIGSS